MADIDDIMAFFSLKTKVSDGLAYPPKHLNALYRDNTRSNHIKGVKLAPA